MISATLQQGFARTFDWNGVISFGFWGILGESVVVQDFVLVVTLLISLIPKVFRIVNIAVGIRQCY